MYRENVLFLISKCTKMRLALGFPQTRYESLQRFPDPRAGLRETGEEGGEGTEREVGV